ncbi:MAG: homocysteine S-methyltransferase family protein [Rhodothalassiaceae bacterium]
MSYAAIQDRLTAGGIVLLDGGVGTELERRGAQMDPGAWCGPASRDNADLLEQVHRAYLDAGAEVITANTYASSRIMLEPAGYGAEVADINRIAVEAAQRARAGCGRDGIAIAGSLSHMAPLAPGTDKTDRSALPSAAAFEDALTELALLLREAGCDLLVLEMLYDPDRIEPVFKAAAASGLPVWAGFSARAYDTGTILSFDRARDIPFQDCLEPLDRYDIAAAGVMHTPSHITAAALDILRAQFDGPLTAYPDSGYFKMPQWQFEDVIAPADFAAFAQGWVRDQGVQVVGGCCGLSPAHIAAIGSLH